MPKNCPNCGFELTGDALGSYIRDERVKQGYTQKALADLIKTEGTHISAIEVGKKKSHTLIAKITKALNLDADKVMSFLAEEQ